MIYTPMTNKAMRFAYNAHQGQVDHNEIPYIFHPYHVAEQMDDEISCTVALLHDVVEDTDVTLDELKAQFPEEVTKAVALLTHDSRMDYFDYILTIKENPVARKVKLADIEHNSDETRILEAGLTSEKIEAWRKKYTKAKALLTE